jgi:hypothetical protein
VKQQRGIDLFRITMNLPRKLWRRLKLQAVKEDTTATNIVVKLVEGYLKKRSGKDGLR